MTLINILSSVNRISILAFFAIFAFLIYEIILFRKQRPKIPKFDGKSLPSLDQSQNIVVEEKKTDLKPNMKPLVISFLLMVIFGVVFLLTYSNINKAKIENNNNPFNFVTSKGIKIYDQSWQELKNNLEANKLKAGDRIFIGLETINEADIDRARIRVNEDQWQTEQITTNFNKEKQLFYKEFFIGSGESRLKIEAQLHSINDGWLGE